MKKVNAEIRRNKAGYELLLNNPHHSDMAYRTALDKDSVDALNEVVGLEIPE